VVVGDRGVAVSTMRCRWSRNYVVRPAGDFSSGIPEMFKGPIHTEVLSPDEPLRLECAAFLDSIVHRRAPLTDGQSACA